MGDRQFIDTTVENWGRMYINRQHIRHVRVTEEGDLHITMDDAGQKILSVSKADAEAALRQLVPPPRKLMVGESGP